MKISLVNPPQSQLREPNAYVPLGLAYIGSSLIEKEFTDIKIENLANNKINEDIYLNNADVFIITYPSSSLNEIKNIINHIKKKYPNSNIILGGPHPSISPLSTYNQFKDCIIVTGEAENFITSIINHLKGNQVDGIYHAGIIPQRLIDNLPFPARHLFNHNTVVNTTGIHGCEKGIKSTTLITSRGCPYKCNFCCKNHSMYNTYRIRSANNIRDELYEIAQDYSIEHVRFVDDCFTLNKKRTEKICQYTKELDISFMCITRADIADTETLQTLKQGNCTTIDIGVESGSDRLLQLINKQESTEQMKKCILNAKKIGLKTKVFLQYNLPTETEEDIQKTIKFLKETKPDYYTLSKFVPLPGSKLYKENTSNLISISDKWFYNDNDEKRKHLINEIENILHN